MKAISKWSMIGFLLAVTGCATSQETRVLEERMMLMSNEMIRMDNQLQQTELALTQERQERLALEEQLSTLETVSEPKPMRVQPKVPSEPIVDLSTNLYKTASGYELVAKDIQTALKNAGYYNGPIDGKIGPMSRESIRSFQNEHQLKADGICGKKTWQQLSIFLNVAK